MKRETILVIEECFRNIQHEKDITRNLRLIESAVKKEFGITVKVSIIDNKKNDFFGMCVYPSPEELIKMSEMLMKTNVSIKDVERVHVECVMKGTNVVEVDSILLYDHNLNATAGEITAILLHEIGHILTSNSVVCRFERAKEHITNKFDNKTRKLVPVIPMISKLFNIVTLQIFSNQFNLQLKKELAADEMATKHGYGPELESILGKFIAHGHGSKVKRTDKEMDKDIEVTIDWLVVNIKELEYRKNRLKRSIKFLKLNTPSKFMADRLGEIHDHVFKKDDENMIEKAVVINEAFILSKLGDKAPKAPSGALDSSGRVKRLSPRDLDIYRAELERVNTVDDKIFLLERLYDLLDVAEYAKQMIATDPRRVMQSEQTIDLYIKHVHEIIDEVNSRKISRTKYGLFIKYPADYEG